MIVPSSELATMINAARRAGDSLIAHFRDRSAITVQLKGPADFVSTADLESEEILRQALLGAYPSFGFLAEESHARAVAKGGSHAGEEGAGGSSGARFIVDPLDGTTNFLHGIPHFAVSIALERRGRVVAGVVFDPAKDEMFVGEEGKGAFVAGERIHVSKDVDFSRAVIGTGIPHVNRPERHSRYLAQLGAIMKEAAGVRRLAAAALDLAYVAAGRFSAFFEFGLAPWDIAAGALLVREAGGQVSEPSGGTGILVSGDVLATNGLLHAQMLELLRRAAPVAG